MQLSSFISANSIQLDIPLEHLNNQIHTLKIPKLFFLSQMTFYLGTFLYMSADYKWDASKSSKDK